MVLSIDIMSISTSYVIIIMSATCIVSILWLFYQNGCIEKNNTLTNNREKRTCVYCLKTGTNSRCSGCKLVFYCDIICQKSHWKKHKKVCNKSNIIFECQKSWDESKYLDRMNTILDMIYNMKSEMKEKSNLYDIICGQYPNDNINYFMTDYGNYVENLDKNQAYLQNLGVCSLRQCKHLQRQCRDRNAHDKWHIACKPGKSMIIQQILDQMHIIKYHLVDIGQRYFENKEAESKKSTTKKSSDFHKRFIKMRNTLMKKRKIFAETTHYQILNSKFVTKLTQLQDAQIQFRIHTDWSSCYQNGFKFYYHQYYKHKDVTTEYIPGAPRGAFDSGNVWVNPNYTFQEWFIYPKYKSLKQEFLQNAYVILTNEQYKYELKKAELKLNSYHGKKIRGSNKRYEIVYNHKENSRITINHILSIVIYTNFNEINYEFSKTFRRIHPKESDDSVRTRHRNFYHWAKYLVETVHCYGDDCGEISFYRGIDRMCFFEDFSTWFYAPTSVTDVLDVAINFATHEGIVIQIADYIDSPTSYFDCRFWSDFPAESEKLFMATINILQIIGLNAMYNDIQYDGWIRALRIFDTVLIKGMYLFDKIYDEDRCRIDLLVETIVDRKKHHTIPKDIVACFHYMVAVARRVNIELYLLQTDIWCEFGTRTGFGGNILKHIYIDNKNNIKWNVISNLFASLHRVNIRCQKPIPSKINSYYMEPSIRLTGGVLQNMLLFLNLCKDRGMLEIHIYNPQNTTISLESLQKKNIWINIQNLVIEFYFYKSQNMLYLQSLIYQDHSN
eukprot:11455_1